MLQPLDLIDNITEPFRFRLEIEYETFITYYFNGNHELAFRIFGLVNSIGVYWLIGLCFAFIEYYRWPKFILDYKVQINKTQLNGKSFRKLLPQIIMNQIIGILIGLLFEYLRSNQMLFSKASDHLPTLSRFIFEWFSFILIRECLFYYLHRLCHYGIFYRRIHKRHHEWQTPIALTAIYCHPIEHIFVNVIPVLIGPFLLCSHPLIANVWLLYTILLTLNDHSGYHFPWSLSPVFHDFHHLKFNVNYGILGLLDWLHGTDRMFRKSKFYKNHFIYFGLKAPSYDFKD